MTLAEISRARKKELASLLQASRQLDSRQEILEREAKRLKNRKVAVPEVEDAERLIRMAQAVAAALANLVALLEALSRSWTT